MPIASRRDRSPAPAAHSAPRRARSVWRVVPAALLLAAPWMLACDSSTPVDPPTAPGSVASIAASPSTLYLQSGQQRAITLEARDASGVLVANPSVTWRSDAPTVATVDAVGVVRAITPGSARVTASSGSLSALVTVGVTAVTPGIQQWRVARAGLTDATLLGIWDDGQGTTYAAGQNGVLLRSRKDGPWEVVPVGTTETLVGIWGSSPTDIWIVGTNGLILHGDGVPFRPVASGTTTTLLEVWGLSANNVYRLGDAGTILRWDGTRWTPEVNPGSATTCGASGARTAATCSWWATTA